VTTAVAPHAADDHDPDFETRLAELLSDAYPVPTPTRAEIDAMFARHDAGRAVVEAAREWRRRSSAVGYARMGDFLIAAEVLAAAVDALEALYASGSVRTSDSTTGGCSALSGEHAAPLGLFRANPAPTNDTEETL
jgi:hypothetical protein